MDTPPQTEILNNNARAWKNNFGTFEATVYVPEPKPELKSDLLNYGFYAPYLLVFAEHKMSFDEAADFAEHNGLASAAADFASSVVFIYPSSGSWKNASPEILSDIITNSRIHQYYKDGYVHAINPLFRINDGYLLRGAIFRCTLIGFGESADYIAENCLKHFEGNGLWGRSDLAPVSCYLTNLSVKPKIDCNDIPVVSYGNSEEINNLLKSKCTYFIERNEPSFREDISGFTKFFRRMIGNLDKDPDLEAEGLIRVPGIATVKTSTDNKGEFKDTEKHDIGYFAFYNKGLPDKGPVPLVLGFHGGGDSCAFFTIMAGWAKICHRNNFLLVTVENHLNSSATETVELVEQLKKIYPIDETRIYATGFSMGGIKTWDLIQEYPSLLAAAAPMDATVDVGQNVYFSNTEKEVNTTVSVPVFYAAGEVTPLPELACQEQRCLNRIKYILQLNDSQKKCDVDFNNQENWENKFWGINGDEEEKSFDNSRNATLTMQKYKNSKGQITTVLSSISGQGHDCREHTCEHAWQFMKDFRRIN